MMLYQILFANGGNVIDSDLRDYSHMFHWDNVITPTLNTPTVITPTLITPTIITSTLNTSTVTDSLCNSGVFSDLNTT
jgi:hypothetical protein